MTIGLLVMAYGTASGPDDIERYYTDIRGGRTPSPELVQELKDRYAAIGGEFPLDRITRAQADRLEAELNRGDDRAFRAYVGYKHSPPFVGDGVRRMAEDGLAEAAGIVNEAAPYPTQHEGTAGATAAMLGLERFRPAWQSAGRTAEPWLGPPLDEVIAKAAADGHTGVVVCACGFTADHLEILYDIDIEAKRAAAAAGIPLVRTRSMNADPDFISAVAAVVRD